MVHKVDAWVWGHKPGTTIKTSGSDFSGTIEYAFNSLGFRGEEPRSNAKIKAYASGCSYTFGTGLGVDQIWPSLFKQKLVKEIGCKEEDINLLNFSSGGKSNDYIVRTLIRQSLAEKPDIIMCFFTHKSRREFLKNDEVNSMRVEDKQYEGYYTNCYTDENGVLNLLKNIYLLKLFCESKGIAYLLGGFDFKLIKDKTYAKNPVIAQYTDFLKEGNIFYDELTYKDRAADGRHPGPKSTEKYTTKFFEEFVEKNKGFIEKAKEKCNC